MILHIRILKIKCYTSVSESYRTLIHWQNPSVCPKTLIRIKSIQTQRERIALIHLDISLSLDVISYMKDCWKKPGDIQDASFRMCVGEYTGFHICKCLYSISKYCITAHDTI